MRNLAILLLLLSYAANAMSQKNWSVDYSRSKNFIENKGQFDQQQNETTGKIRFGIDFGKSRVFFGEKGISYVFLDAEKSNKNQEYPTSKTKEDHKNWEKQIGKYTYRYDEVNVHLSTKSNATIQADGLQNDLHSYTFTNSSGLLVNKSDIKGYNKITYKNISPGIDLEYIVHPQSGLKYALNVQPNSKPGDFKMIYDRDVQLIDGAIHIETLFGEIVDHEPLSFYEHADNATIPSAFKLEKSRIVSFTLGNYQTRNPIVIDPWTQLPSFPSNWDCVWECDKDAAGNVYAIGGVMPMQLLKYNAAGALQWTYNTPYDTSNVWLGTLAVDNLGNSYITAGSVAQIQKVNTSGALVWNNPSPGGLFGNEEFWSISFNCDQSKLVVGGTGGSGLNLEAAIYDINVTTGNVTSSINVAQGNVFGFPPTIQEVRAICASPSGKYYFMTQDTVGSINQNFNACGGNPLFYKIDNGYDLGYKCENYRYDNSGISAIKANTTFYYTQNGVNVAKRNLQTGAVIGTAAIPGGANTTALGDFSVSNSGLDIDNCGNVYVGSSNGVVKYDANLIQLATYPTNFKVYDVHVSTGGDIVAVGSTGNSSSNIRTGYIQSFAAGACAPLASNCCDASICNPQNVCLGDAPLQLTAATAGGTWSGPGISPSGLFTPANAGVGNQTITYTLSCGSESVNIVVSPCQGLTACIEANGSITVTGGVAPYSWAYYQAAQNTPITTQAQCVSCGYTWFFGQCLNGVMPVSSCNSPAQWVNFGNGTNATAPVGATQVQISDAGGTVQVFTISTLLPCSINPCPNMTVVMSNVSNVSCFGISDGQATATASGGASPYTYNWMSGNLNGAVQNSLGAGTYTITATDQNGCTGDTTLTIQAPLAISIDTLSVIGTTCGNSTGSITLNVSGGAGNFSCNWNPNVGNGPSIQNLSGGSYTIVVTDQNGCGDSLTILVPTYGGPNIDNITIANASCSGINDGSIQIQASGATAPYTYSINGGMAQSSPNFIGLGSGSYTVNVFDSNLCQNSQTISINAPSALSINLTSGFQICTGDSVLVQATVSGSTPPYNYQWSNGSIGNPIWLQPNVTTTYQLTVNDVNSCSETQGITVAIVPCGSIQIFIPNVFSPNGDNSNDGYGIISTNVISQEAIIVNRWGQLMAELNQVNQLWDGLTFNGDEATEGVYFMKYRVQGLNAEEKQGHVFFHLVRQ